MASSSKGLESTRVIQDPLPDHMPNRKGGLLGVTEAMHSIPASRADTRTRQRDKLRQSLFRGPLQQVQVSLPTL